MGYLEIKLSLNSGYRPDLEKAAVTFAQAIERIGILVTGRCPVDSAGNAIRVRAEGVTGLPEATVKGSFMPGNDRTAGMLNLTVLQHPDGPDGASKATSELADRIAEAFGLDLGKIYKEKPKRNAGHHLLRAANGWNGEFQAVFADWRP